MRLQKYPRTWEESFHMDVIWRRLRISGNEMVLPVVPRELARRNLSLRFHDFRIT